MDQFPLPGAVGISHLRAYEWEAEDGSKRQKLEVVANQVDFLDSPRNSGSDEATADAEPAEATA